MGDAFDNTAIESGRTTKSRNLERFLRQIISDLQQAAGTHATTTDILERTQVEGFNDDRVMAVLETMTISGILFRPRGYGTYQLA